MIVVEDRTLRVGFQERAASTEARSVVSAYHVVEMYESGRPVFRRVSTHCWIRSVQRPSYSRPFRRARASSTIRSSEAPHGRRINSMFARYESAVLFGRSLYHRLTRVSASSLTWAAFTGGKRGQRRTTGRGDT